MLRKNRTLSKNQKQFLQEKMQQKRAVKSTALFLQQLFLHLNAKYRQEEHS